MEWISMDERHPQKWQWVSIRLHDGTTWNRAQWNGTGLCGVGIGGECVSHWRAI